MHEDSCKHMHSFRKIIANTHTHKFISILISRVGSCMWISLPLYCIHELPHQLRSLLPHFIKEATLILLLGLCWKLFRPCLAYWCLLHARSSLDSILYLGLSVTASWKIIYFSIVGAVLKAVSPMPSLDVCYMPIPRQYTASRVVFFLVLVGSGIAHA